MHRYGIWYSIGMRYKLSVADRAKVKAKVRAHRAAQAEKGLKPLTVWVPSVLHDEARAAVANLVRRA